MGESQLSTQDIADALAALAEDLAATGLSVCLVVGGGAAMALGYNARATTKDVDAYTVEDHAGDTAAVRAAARRVAESRGLPEDWLNDAFKGYIRSGTLGKVLFESPSLTVRALAPEVLLAMKLSASRDDVDFADARVLLSHLSGTKDEIWSTVEKLLMPGRELTACYVFNDLWEAIHGPD